MILLAGIILFYIYPGGKLPLHDKILVLSKKIANDGSKSDSGHYGDLPVHINSCRTTGNVVSSAANARHAPVTFLPF